MKNYTVIAYDIADDKRRQRVAELLAGHGKRINYSVFQCLLTKKSLEKIRNKIKAMIDKKTDTVVYYILCKDCFSKTFIDGFFNNDTNVVNMI
ncbi:MAG: CRISPR-associated endonuclease Cas2 [Candidatus Kuenenia sp.]|nr:CRISPR-associated endonuclease Cas2 [Candidatus Kuenenia hertensis]